MRLGRRLAREQRRLAAILAADVVGYSKLAGSDESGTLALLQKLRSDVIEPAIAMNSGRLFKVMGDGFLIEFASAVQAVNCARSIQQENSSGRLLLRIGIHVGDVVVDGDDLMGDGVNIAARIEGIADAGGIAISRQVRDQVRDKLDVELVDKGEVELKNIVRPVRIFTIGGAKKTVEAEALALPEKPSIAVLPFQNMSGDPEQEYFADGMVEEITSALTRFRWLFVIARSSTSTFKGRTVDVKQVSRELGVRYLLEGSVRKAANRVRIAAQLIDATRGAHLWADRFEGSLENIFELQDQVASAVVGAIDPKLLAAEMARSEARNSSRASARSPSLSARAPCSCSRRARKLCRRACASEAGAQKAEMAGSEKTMAAAIRRTIKPGPSPDLRLPERRPRPQPGLPGSSGERVKGPRRARTPGECRSGY